ncbi:aldehyde oxidoreductase [Methylobacterium sp. OAE515]|uniref:molybdopterin-dependent oxidoreductase n=1 Tax=Methylobacterium sp. OAE515 TaxID=2817895 RepID=UPI0019FD0590
MMDHSISFVVNGESVTFNCPPEKRLTDALRDELGLIGTKIGCGDGQCGACTISFNGNTVYSCLMCLGQAAEGEIVTVEGLNNYAGDKVILTRLQQAFHDYGAVQCGFCTPGMLIAAQDLLNRCSRPTEQQIRGALSGVLCRCTGYRKIIEAIQSLNGSSPAQSDQKSCAVNVGSRSPNVDGIRKISGSELYAADVHPSGGLFLRAIRSTYHHARFTIDDLSGLYKRYPGLSLVLTAADIPGQNAFGVYPTGKDQPVFADGYVRFRGEAICAIVGDEATIARIKDTEIPISWIELTAIHGVEAGISPDMPQLHSNSPNNILVEGCVSTGNVDEALATSEERYSNLFTTSFVEHAYLETEAGFAVRRQDRLEIFATTQSPYMDRDEIALIMGLPPEKIRIIPSAVGGGFGGKVDLSVQPMIAVAAWRLNRPVRCTYTRKETFTSTTKRHPAKMEVSVGSTRNGILTAVKFFGDFNTGAYASWGPTVAGRVPIHAMGPYRVPVVDCTARAVYTNDTPAGAFRGFGVPQAAVALESAMDELALQLNLCPFEFRYRNVLEAGCQTSTGQTLTASVGIRSCLDVLRSFWEKSTSEVKIFNSENVRHRRGIGIACGWYGIGNTAQSNPSTMRIGVNDAGEVTLYSGALEIGQGSNTVLSQICADALHLPLSSIRLVTGDTDLTADAGKTSASRQTFISGTAVSLAAEDLLRQVFRLVNASNSSAFMIKNKKIIIEDDDVMHLIDLSQLPRVNSNGDVLLGEGTFDPPTTPLDDNGKGDPYATYSFSAQIAVVEVDLDLGTTNVVHIAAAADVGRAVNPMMVEGQIHGGVAQGLGMALMEKFIPGETESFADYLIPTIEDVPPIDVYIVEDREPLSSVGAKGVGEPALIPTAPAILNAIRDATGVRVTELPVSPAFLRNNIKANILKCDEKFQEF